MDAVFEEAAFALRTALRLLEEGTPHAASGWAVKADQDIQAAIKQRREDNKPGEADEGQPVKGDDAKDGVRVCTMNCGPGIGDTRTREERMAGCDDCWIVRGGNHVR